MEARKLAAVASSPFQLSLRVRHPSMDPQQISRELQIEADHSFRAGQPRESSAVGATGAVHTESYWVATLNQASWLADTASILGELGGGESGRQPVHAMTLGVLEAALAVCAINLLRMHATFIRRLHAEGGEVSLLVTLAPKKTRGFTLTPHVSRVLGELGIAVDFEFSNR